VDLGTVAVLALLIILIAVAILVSRQGLLASSITELRWQHLMPRQSGDEETESGAAVGGGNDLFTDQLATRVSPPSRVNPAAVTPSAVNLPPTPSASPIASTMPLDLVGTQLERLDTKLTELTQSIDRHDAAIAALLRQSMTDLAQRAAAEEARSDAAVQRLRADVLAVMTSTRADADRSRRKEVCAELYVTLARFEAALSAVSNPVLLPGEPYAIPDELPASALVWENWNDVGERVFVLADTFNTQGLHLSQQAREDLAQFLTTLRTLLTGTIYPNLQSGAGSGQELALRQALNQIARGLRDLREALEREYEGPSPRS